MRDEFDLLHPFRNFSFNNLIILVSFLLIIFSLNFFVKTDLKEVRELLIIFFIWIFFIIFLILMFIFYNLIKINYD